MSEQNEHLPSYFLIFHNDRLILREDYTPYTARDDTMLGQEVRYNHIIGKFDETIVYCAEYVSDLSRLKEPYVLLPIKQALDRLPSPWYHLVVRAVAIIQWDKNHRYCGRCGCQTEEVNNLFEKRCPACQLLFYPRISPSVIVMIEKGDYILMARSPHFVPGAYGLIAGFVDAGETLEEAVHREVREEVGMTITALRYMGSQAWPFPDSLVVAFRAEYDSGELTIDHNELESAGWYRYDALPGHPSSKISIARKLIDCFVFEKQNLV